MCDCQKYGKKIIDLQRENNHLKNTNAYERLENDIRQTQERIDTLKSAKRSGGTIDEDTLSELRKNKRSTLSTLSMLRYQANVLVGVDMEESDHSPYYT